MRARDIVPLGLPDSGPYALVPGFIGRGEPVGSARVGFLLSPLYWGVASVGLQRARIRHVTGRGEGKARLLFALSGQGEPVDDAVIARVRERAGELQRTTFGLEALLRGHPDVFELPEGCKLLHPVEVWGTWTAWRHAPNRLPVCAHTGPTAFSRAVAGAVPAVEDQPVTARVLQDRWQAIADIVGAGALEDAGVTPMTDGAPTRVGLGTVLELVRAAADRGVERSS